MFRTIIAPMAALGFVALVTMPAQAENVNIHPPVDVTQTSSSSFDVSAKVTGLAGGDCFLAIVSGNVSGTVQCSNPGQPHQPKPKRFSEPVSTTETGVAGGNGNIDPLTVSVPVTTPSASICTNGNTSGWTVTLLSFSGKVTYEVCDIGPATTDSNGNLICPSTTNCAAPAGGEAGEDSVINISVP